MRSDATGWRLAVPAGGRDGPLPQVREEKPVATTSIGADSVANAIYAIAFARLYLADDSLVRPSCGTCCPSAKDSRRAGVGAASVALPPLPPGLARAGAQTTMRSPQYC